MTELLSKAIWIVLIILLPRICYSQANDSTSSSNAKSSEVFTVVQKPPEYIGGEKKFMKFMKKNSKYKISSKKEIGLTVFYQFVITEKGDLKQIRILKDPPKNVQNELIRLLEMMPNWIPGYQNSIPVNVRLTREITFVFD